MSSDRFDYAVWRLEEKGDPGPLKKELARLEKTTIGAQIVRARTLLAAEPDGGA
jgi:hypothetical protein